MREARNDALGSSGAIGDGMVNTHDLAYTTLLTEARKVSERLGMWVLHEVQEAHNMHHLIGYFIYRLDGLDRRKRRAKTDGNEARATFLAARTAYWSRACRMIQRMARGEHQAIARRLIFDLARDEATESIPYVAATEVEISDEPEDRRDKLEEVAKLVPGRPKAQRLRQYAFTPCGTCDGLGLLQRRGARPKTAKAEAS